MKNKLIFSTRRLFLLGGAAGTAGLALRLDSAVENSAYALVELLADGTINVVGYRKEVARELPLSV